jgi:hypothetical protein
LRARCPGPGSERIQFDSAKSKKNEKKRRKGKSAHEFYREGSNIRNQPEIDSELPGKLSGFATVWRVSTKIERKD